MVMIRRGLIFGLLLLVGLTHGCAGRLPPVREKRDIAAIKQLKNGDYQLLVNRKPYVVRGVVYAPVAIGQSYLHNWMCNPNKPWVADGKLMEEMGVNTIRLYEPGDEWKYCKEVIEYLYDNHGIRTILGHSLGFWDYPPANYAEEEFTDYVTKDVLKMIEYFKDTRGILMWNLGNENNYSFDGRINPWSSDEIDDLPSFGEKRQARARIYYSYVNELTKKIKQIDPYRPVSLGNGETVGLKEAAEYCPEVDLIGAIVYRGKNFGNFFKQVKRLFDKPVVFMEFGCDAYNAYTQKEDQKSQAEFLKSQWLDIEKNMAGGSGAGNCLGGTIFEWTDEWWKTSESDRDSWLVHDTTASWGMGAYAFDAKAGKNMNEEWFGIVAIEPELEDGINRRVPRRAYYVLREMWTKDVPEKAQRKRPKKK